MLIEQPEMTDTILVLYDFTEIAEHALHHAIKLAKNRHLPLCLLHIIHSSQIPLEKQDELSQKKKEKEINHKLEEVVKKAQQENQIKINYVVKYGNIFTDIGIFEKEAKAGLIVMGTHGSKGIQQYIGSNVVRVIAGSSIPIIVVQKSPSVGGYKKIVVPIDFSNELETLKKQLIIFSVQYQSSIYLFNNTRPNHSVQELIQQNVVNIKQLLGDQKIKYSVKQAVVGKEPFANQIVEYANGIGADMIMIITNQAKGLSDFFLIQYMQKVIMNSFGIPVMCVNPKTIETIEIF